MKAGVQNFLRPRAQGTLVAPLLNVAAITTCSACCGAIAFPCYASVNSLDGRVIRTSATGAVDSGLNPSRIKPMTLKLLFAASLLDAQL